jgi:hypothetical protein
MVPTTARSVHVNGTAIRTEAVHHRPVRVPHPRRSGQPLPKRCTGKIAGNLPASAGVYRLGVSLPTADPAGTHAGSALRKDPAMWVLVTVLIAAAAVFVVRFALVLARRPHR